MWPLKCSLFAVILIIRDILFKQIKINEKASPLSLWALLFESGLNPNLGLK